MERTMSWTTIAERRRRGYELVRRGGVGEAER
jgi:hypothetical protein